MVFIILGILLILAGLGLVVKVLFFSENSGPAAIQVNSFPKGEILINGEKVGQTPFDSNKYSAGDYTVRVTATVNSTPVEWSGKVKLTAGTVTYINRELAIDPASSAGEILSLERIADSAKSELVIISEPSGAIVKLDGQDKGMTPLTIADISASDHEIAISSAGFRDRFLRGKTVAGYRLNLSVQLAKMLAVTASPSALQAQQPVAASSAAATTSKPTTASTSAEIARPYIVVKSTPTGWLRVREAPSTAATESGKVNPGERLPLLAEQEGWVKIRFKGINEGWVSDTYVEKVK